MERYRCFAGTDVVAQIFRGKPDVRFGFRRPLGKLEVDDKVTVYPYDNAESIETVVVKVYSRPSDVHAGDVVLERVG